MKRESLLPRGEIFTFSSYSWTAEKSVLEISDEEAITAGNLSLCAINLNPAE